MAPVVTGRGTTMTSIRIAVISLPDAARRRARVQRDFAASPFPWRFVDASDGSTTAVPYRPDLAVRLMGRELNRAEIGCFDSHYRALAEFAADGSGHLMVCEDDLWIDFGFPFGALADAMDSAGVGYLRLYARRAAGARHIAYWCDRWLVRYMWEPFGTQCYLVSVVGARALLAGLDRIARPIDNEFDRFWENGLPAYSFVPAPVLELSSPSSIVRPPDAAATGGRRVAYRARRALDRAVSVAAGLRRTRLDARFAAALRAQLTGEPV